MSPKYTAHVISNTHWDREWRYPFQTYRLDLVDLIDQLLDILDRRPDYRAFLLDSQTVILEDYLEIRPENYSRLCERIEEGRIQIGPWYTLPDEWGCPGEAIVRNLVMGHRTAKEYGPVFKSGYTPFSNGQISQMPQIYREFGIDHILFYRGISRADAKSEFQWQGADGSWIYGFRFGIYSRYNYYYLVYRPGLLDRQLKDRDYTWTAAQVPWHVASDASQDRQYSWGNLELKVQEQNLGQALKDCLKHSAQDATTSQLMYFMGHDHSFAHEGEVELISALQKAADPAEQEIFFGSLDEYVDAFRAEAKNLEVLKGEMRNVLRDGLWTTLMANILSCRLYLKQRNAEVNAKIIQIAEPLAAAATMMGARYPGKLLELAWKDILKNQAHDAIGGCSVDAVHREMLTRWDAVEQIGEGVARRAMRDLLLAIDGSKVGRDDLQLTVFNTLPHTRDEIAEFTIDLPHGTADEEFEVRTLDGTLVESQVIAREGYEATIESPVELTMTMPVARRRALVDLKNLPGMGHDVLVVKRNATAPTGAGIAANATTLENAKLRVTINGDGSFDILHKASGTTLKNQGVLEDTAEFGDPWNRVQPAGDAPILSTSHAKASTAIAANGTLGGTIRVEYVLTIPAGKEAAPPPPLPPGTAPHSPAAAVKPSDVRSAATVSIPVTLLVTLKKDAEEVELHLSFDNTAKDHRLRMLFPSGVAAATHSTADGQFDVVQRAIKLPDATGWKEKPFATHPMWHFVDVTDGQRGHAVIADGLIEYEVKDDAERTIAITLLRAFGKFVYGRPTPESQCLGLRSYRLVVRPHAGTWYDADLVRRGLRHMTPVQATLSAPTTGTAAPRRELLRIDGPGAVFSAVKQGEDEKMIVVRAWNSGDADAPMTFHFGVPIKDAWRLTMEETVVEKIPTGLNAMSFTVSAGARKIVTVGILV